jgi:hypothetical protein
MLLELTGGRKQLLPTMTQLQLTKIVTSDHADDITTFFQ